MTAQRAKSVRRAMANDYMAHISSSSRREGQGHAPEKVVASGGHGVLSQRVAQYPPPQPERGAYLCSRSRRGNVLHLVASRPATWPHASRVAGQHLSQRRAICNRSTTETNATMPSEEAELNSTMRGVFEGVGIEMLLANHSRRAQRWSLCVWMPALARACCSAPVSGRVSISDVPKCLRPRIRLTPTHSIDERDLRKCLRRWEYQTLEELLADP